MKNLKFIFTVIFILILLMQNNITYNQTRTIYGKVINAISGNPIPGVKVEIKETAISTISSSTGNYSLTIPDNIRAIKFSDFSGMEMLEVIFISSEEINIYLSKSDIFDLSLEELLNIKVTGVSRFIQSADKAPNNVIVITEQQIESRGYQDLSDVLKDIPGFDISDNASRDGEYYTLRVIQGNERILVLIDGHKLNSPSGTLLSIGNSIKA
jgi:hypothetical protein